MNVSKLIVLISICSLTIIVKSSSDSDDFLHYKTNLEKDSDPDINRSIEEEILSKEYQLETHYSTTSDGFILKIYRISGFKGKSNIGNAVVHLQHGLGVSTFLII
jgi:hypothetical protein